MMWKNATLWPEPELHPTHIPKEVIAVVGEEYMDYAKQPALKFAAPTSVAQTNMLYKDGALLTDETCPDAPYVIYDFGKLL